MRGGGIPKRGEGNIKRMKEIIRKEKGMEISKEEGNIRIRKKIFRKEKEIPEGGKRY